MADPVIRDFQATRTRSATAGPSSGHNARLSLDLEQNNNLRRHNTLSPAAGAFVGRGRSHSRSSSLSVKSDDIVERRITRHDTVRRYHDLREDYSASPSRQAWEEPGAEPGIDTTKEPDSRFSHMLQECQITIVDFSNDRMSKYELDNEGLELFMQKPRDDWVKTRWINVNGFSYDVISLLQAEYGLHGLAIEDMLSIRGRTKIDWYPDHAFIFFSLQKLIRAKKDELDSKNDKLAHDRHKHRSRWRKMFTRHEEPAQPAPAYSGEKPASNGDLLGVPEIQENGRTSMTSNRGLLPKVQTYRTLQRSRAGQNFERMLYMERNSMLTQKSLAVSVEKVAVFLTASNTVISFFEHSADDIEPPILRRLARPDTIIRSSNDASMVVQAVIDAVVDLAMPVVAAYEDIISELEVDVLTDPEMAHSRMLYIVASEMSMVRSNLQPISTIISAIRDHQREAMRDRDERDRNTRVYSRSSSHAPGLLPTETSLSSDSSTSRNKIIPTVDITGLAVTYFGDVEDHVVSMSGHLDNMRRTTSDLIDLLYNQMGAFQNESMKVLTAVTIFFLPLTFLTGYFGQNFERFDAVKDHSDAFFWEIAVPVMVLTILVLTRPILVRFIKRQGQKLWIFRQKKARQEKLRRTNTMGSVVSRTSSYTK